MSTLFTSTSAIASWLGSSGLMLRMDDSGTFNGTITGATNTSPIIVTSTAHGLNTGDLIQMTGVRGNSRANGPWIVTYLSANTFSLNDSDGTLANAYTTGGTWIGITYPESDWLLQAANLGTSKVLQFVQTLYDASQLTASWNVYAWATIIGAHWFCGRRNNPIPTSIMNFYLEALEELNGVKQQQITIADAAYRNEVMPTWSALRVDRRWTIKQMRVEAVLSSRTRPQFPRKQDFGAQIIGPIEPDSISL